MSWTYVSLYAGAGGLDLGFIRAGFEPVWTNELDPFAAATYEGLTRRHFPDHRVAVGDLSSQRWPSRGSADLVIGGPPCQGFSVAGKMNPNDPRSQHVWTFLKIVQRVQPSMFVMENVKALATNEKWAEVRKDLQARARRLGYQTELIVLNASHFGVPQARERMFFIGTRETEVAEPRATTARTPPTLRTTLLRLPPAGHPGNATVCPAAITPARRPVLRPSPFAGMLFNGHGRPVDLNAPGPTLHATMGGNGTPIIDQLQLDEDAPPWVIQYHRRLMRGGRPVKRVPRHLRRLTVEEAAAAQTFPSAANWAGPQSAQYRQIGNAVPPRLSYHVAKAVRDSLNS
jgi:DNA (cytosine-5)-methyltransferase 1